MTRHPITTTGNAKPWRSDGYRDRMSVPGPLVAAECSLSWDWFDLAALAVILAVTGLAVGYSMGWVF